LALCLWLDSKNVVVVDNYGIMLHFLIYTALLQLEKKFKENNKYYENSFFLGTNTNKRKNTLKIWNSKEHVGDSSCETMGQLLTRIVLCTL